MSNVEREVEHATSGDPLGLQVLTVLVESIILSGERRRNHLRKINGR